MVYRLYAAPFVSCFVHTLRLAGMAFNNICRFKKKVVTLVFILQLLIPVTSSKLGSTCHTFSNLNCDRHSWMYNRVKVKQNGIII